jgi:hypothetical protein
VDVALAMGRGGGTAEKARHLVRIQVITVKSESHGGLVDEIAYFVNERERDHVAGLVWSMVVVVSTTHVFSLMA